jgi:hypothetical protein
MDLLNLLLLFSLTSLLIAIFLFICVLFCPPFSRLHPFLKSQNGSEFAKSVDYLEKAKGATAAATGGKGQQIMTKKTMMMPTLNPFYGRHKIN